MRGTRHQKADMPATLMTYRYNYPSFRVLCIVNRVRKISMEILEKYEDSFGENFEDNKSALMIISTITSKELKNEIAGFITKTVKRAAREEQKRQEDQRAREEEAAELARLEAAERIDRKLDAADDVDADSAMETPDLKPDTITDTDTDIDDANTAPDDTVTDTAPDDNDISPDAPDAEPAVESNDGTVSDNKDNNDDDIPGDKN